MSQEPYYQRVYGVGLLDDLHNYFPALLYEQNRFLNLTHVFHYIRSQMSQRFNLYTYGANLYNEQNGMNMEPTIRITPINTNMNTNEESLATTSILLSLLSSLSSLPGSRINPNQPMTPMTPVIVRPTPEIIQTNTTILPGNEAPPNSICSICQDSIRPSESSRKLNYCNHIYHRSCIDTWFERSVFCPTCRHDIREN
jgi:hypothetical protein